MGIIQRFGDIMRSNVNALLDKCEDPAKLIEQTLLDLRRDLAEVKKDTANVIADEKNAKRKLDECAADIEKYTTAAQNALRAGNEDDARKLVAKKQKLQENYESLKATYELAQSNSEKMRQMHDKLCEDINELEMKKDTIKGKVSAAKAQQKVNKVVSSSSKSSASISAFERMEAKADKMLDSAMAEAELNATGSADDDLVKKYSGTGSASVEDELEAMKKDLGL